MGNKDLEILERNKNKIDQKIRDIVENKLKSIFKDVTVDNGFTLLELCKKIYNKDNISIEKKKIVYSCICSLRQKTLHCLACIDNKYGWARTKEQIDQYRLSNLENSFAKCSKNLRLFKENYQIEGIKGDPEKLIIAKANKFNLKFLESKQSEGN